jgi:Uma2 family endonuclease
MGVAATQHDGPFSEAEYLALPEDSSQRVELIDGTLMMSPAPTRVHQRISFRLATILDQAVPEGFEVQRAINIRLDRDRILIPDLVVLTQVGGDELVAAAAEVAVFIEIVSPSTKRVDRLLKPGLAAEVGIPHFWLVEPEGPVVTAYELDGSDYQQSVTATGDQHISLTEPFPVDFSPSELLAARRQK